MVWDELGVIGDRGERLHEPGPRLRDHRFLPDATLNVAENLLREPSDELAIVFRGEDGEAVDVTRAELHDMVGRIQVLLRDAGVEVGDRSLRGCRTGRDLCGDACVRRPRGGLREHVTGFRDRRRDRSFRAD